MTETVVGATGIDRGRRATIAAEKLLFVLGGLLAGAVLLPAGNARVLCFAAVSGIAPLLLVRHRWNISELVVIAPISSLFMWGLLAPLLWRMGPLTGGAALPALTALGLGVWARRRSRQIEVEISIVDLIPAVGILAALIPILAVFSHNGPSGDGYVARGWVARDSFYFFALVQESIERHALPSENPFLAGVPNHYPSLLHAGFAALSMQSGHLAAVSVQWLAPLYLLATAGLLVLVCFDRDVSKLPVSRFLFSAGLSLAAAATLFLLRPDLMIFVQPQAFASGGLLLLIWLTRDERCTSMTDAAAAGIVGAALVLAHTVSGAAAVIVIGCRALELLVERTTRRCGAAMMVIAGVLVFSFRAVNTLPFEGPRQALSIQALTGLEPFVRPWIAPAIGVAMLAILSWRRPFRALAPVGLAGLGAAYYLYGATLALPNERWFVWFNAERFVFVALLVALPLAARERRALGALALACIALGASLAPTALAKDTIELVNAAPLVLEASDLDLFEDIRRETPIDARFLTNLRTYALPAFTGRSQNPIHINLWGLNTLDATEFDARYADATNFFAQRGATERFEILGRWGYTHVLLKGDASPDKARSWVEREFAPGSVRIMRNDGRYLLLARDDGQGFARGR